MSNRLLSPIDVDRESEEIDSARCRALLQVRRGSAHTRMEKPAGGGAAAAGSYTSHFRVIESVFDYLG